MVIQFGGLRDANPPYEGVEVGSIRRFTVLLSEASMRRIGSVCMNQKWKRVNVCKFMLGFARLPQPTTGNDRHGNGYGGVRHGHH